MRLCSLNIAGVVLGGILFGTVYSRRRRGVQNFRDLPRPKQINFLRHSLCRVKNRKINLNKYNKKKKQETVYVLNFNRFHAVTTDLLINF